jgi:hypothetical protein
MSLAILWIVAIGIAIAGVYLIATNRRHEDHPMGDL